MAVPSLSGFLAALREAFAANVGLKALSLAFSIGLFAFLHGQQDSQQRTIPVDVVMRLPENDDRQLMTTVPKNIHVTVTGSARAIDSLIQSRIEPLTIDLRNGYETDVEFQRSMFKLPRDVKITIIDPPNLTLEWQDVVTRPIHLLASTTGQPADGHVLRGEPIVTPAQIRVRGPRSIVEVMQLARLLPFDLSRLAEGTHRRRIAVEAPPNRVTYLDPPHAEVSITIGKRTSEARFSKRPVEIVGVTGGVATPPTVDVTVIGPPEVIRSLRSDQIVPRIDVGKLVAGDGAVPKHGSAAAPVAIDLAHTEAQIQPPSVTVKW